MSVSLKDGVKLTIGFQGVLQDAGTNNPALMVQLTNNIWFLGCLLE